VFNLIIKKKWGKKAQPKEAQKNSFVAQALFRTAQKIPDSTLLL
jgi:hypothetical protein